MTKYKVLQQHPELAPYAAFIPAIGDEAALNQAVEGLIAARNADLQAQLGTKAPATVTTPELTRTAPAPARVGTPKKTAAEISAWILEARGDSKEVSRRLEESKRMQAAGEIE